MTFLQWCMRGQEDDRPIRVTVRGGKVYEPNVPYSIEEVNHLKRLTVASMPKVVDGIWDVVLEAD